MVYSSYNDIRGSEAKPISVALGIDEPSEFSNTDYLVEVRKASDHFRLSAHATTYSREVFIFNNRSLEVVELDTVAEEARKTVYDRDGTITSLKAPWSVEANGFIGGYVEIERVEGKGAEVDKEWERYDAILMKAESLAFVKR